MIQHFFPRETRLRSAELGALLAYMSIMTYVAEVSPKDRPLVWLGGEIKTPPLSTEARVEAGFLLRKLQAGESLLLPHSRPMPVIGSRCHELRIQDRGRIWRIIHRIDRDAVVILEVFAKTSQTTPKKAIEVSQQRLRRYEAL